MCGPWPGDIAKRQVVGKIDGNGGQLGQRDASRRQGVTHVWLNRKRCGRRIDRARQAGRAGESGMERPASRNPGDRDGHRRIGAARRRQHGESDGG